MSEIKPSASTILSRKRPNRGFTLVEVVIAFALLGLVISVAYSALSSIMRSKQLLDSERAAQSLADAILMRLSRELQLASADEALLPPPNSISTGTPGTAQGEASMYLEGVPSAMSNGNRADSITFIASEAGQYLPDGSGNSGLIQITYRVAEDPEGAHREPRRYYLVREEVPYVLPADKAYERRMVFPITKELVELRFRYYSAKRKGWFDEWGQEKNDDKLPTMVEFRVGILSPTGKLVLFTSAVPVTGG